MTNGPYKTPERRAALWDAALRLGSFTAGQLASEAGGDVRRVRATVADWEKDGRALRTGQKGKSHLFRVTGARGAERRAGTPAEMCWRAARLLKQFSPAVLAMHAATPETPVSDAEAAEICRVWLKAGYLRVIQKAQPGRRPAVYHLVRDTGPRAPVERRIRAVWDPNLGQFAHVCEPSA